MTTFGIIGTGVIASAVATGFCSSDRKDIRFVVSPRNEAKAAALKAQFPDRVTIAASNQEVLDQADWVILSILPRMAQEILSELTFKPEHKILTLMSDFSVAKVGALVAPATHIVRMVPLTFISMGIGPVPYYPEDPEIHDLFASVGEPIPISEEKSLGIISGLTGLMSTYYLLVSDIVDMGVQEGMDRQASLSYITAFLTALNQKAAATGDPHGLAYEYTPGGLNELALMHVTGQDGLKPWHEAFDKIMTRLKK